MKAWLKHDENWSNFAHYKKGQELDVVGIVYMPENLVQVVFENDNGLLKVIDPKYLTFEKPEES